MLTYYSYNVTNYRLKLLLSNSTTSNLKRFKRGPFNVLWWFYRGCSPLPIPNREVKPLMADGTAQQCGRVGSCHILLKEAVSKLFGTAFFHFTQY